MTAMQWSRSAFGAPAPLDEGPLQAAAARVDRDQRSPRERGDVTPTFFRNVTRYDGAWDAFSLSYAFGLARGHACTPRR